MYHQKLELAQAAAEQPYFVGLATVTFDAAMPLLTATIAFITALRTTEVA